MSTRRGLLYNRRAQKKYREKKMNEMDHYKVQVSAKQHSHVTNLMKCDGLLLSSTHISMLIGATRQ